MRLPRAVDINETKAIVIDLLLTPIVPESTLAVATMAEAAVEVDGRALSVGSREGSVSPGPHQVHVWARDYKPWSPEVLIATGGQVAISAMLEPEPRTNWWLVGTAAAVTFVGLGVGAYYAFNPEPTAAPPPVFLQPVAGSIRGGANREVAFERYRPVVNCGTCSGDVEGMVLIPGGTFTYGAPDSDPDGGDDEKPQTRATLASFWMDETEVTTTAYAACLAAGACTKGNSGGYCNMQVDGLPIEGRECHPVNCIDWCRASAHRSWRGHRLPTEVEWEYEARGGDGGPRTYPWGEEIPTPARVCMSDREDADLEKSCEVGAHPLGNSRHGLKDMSGNAWEWTASV